MAVNIYKRPLKWWQEETEEPIGNRLTENYSAAELKPGSDGRNVPSVTKQYVKKGGNGLGTEKLSISEKKPAKATLKEEDELNDMEDPEMGANFNDEGDIPAELGDDEGMDDMGDEDFGETEMDIDDIQISIGGKSYNLVPTETGEGEEGMGDELGDELGDEEGLGDELEGGDGGEFGDEGDEEEEILEAAKRVRARLLKERKNREIAKKRAALKEEGDMDADLYDWSNDLGDESPVMESAKSKAKREAIDTLGGKKLAMEAGQSGSSKKLSAADVGLEGGNEFTAPRTQGNASKAAAYKPSSSTGKYGEKAKALFLKKKLEAKRAAVAKRVAEDLDPFEQEDVMSKKELDDLANLPYDIGAEDKTIEVYENVKNRRAERAAKLGEKVTEQPKAKLNFAKLLKEGFGRDSMSGI